MNSTRTGKIARLPARLREELNARLHNGEKGCRLVEWLNGLPEVQTIIVDQFGGRPIRPQNLSEWRQGGYLDWLHRRESQDISRQLFNHPNLTTDVLARLTTVGYCLETKHLRNLNGLAHWRKLRQLTQDISRLRRDDHEEQRLQLARLRAATALAAQRRDPPNDPAAEPNPGTPPLEEDTNENV